MMNYKPLQNLCDIYSEQNNVEVSVYMLMDVAGYRITMRNGDSVIAANIAPLTSLEGVMKLLVEMDNKLKIYTLTGGLQVIEYSGDVPTHIEKETHVKCIYCQSINSFINQECKNCGAPQC